MAKYGIKIGDKISARSPIIRDENTFIKIGGHQLYPMPLNVTKVFNHGVRTKEMGYVHNNNIVSKIC